MTTRRRHTAASLTSRLFGALVGLDALWLIAIVIGALALSGADVGIWILFVGAAGLLLTVEHIFGRVEALLAARAAQRVANSTRAQTRAKRAAATVYGPSMLPAVRRRKR